MVVEDSLYIKFIDEAFELCRRVPRHFSKYSNKIFNNHQHVVLLVLKQKLKKTYKDLVELLKVTCIPEYIGLKRIPHYTTLVKFSQKVSAKIINFLLNITTATWVAVDGTGFEQSSKSYYYRTAWNSDRPRKRRKFVKLSICADVDKQIILSHKIRMGPRNDNIDFKQLVKGLNVEWVLADKGYDSKENRKFVYKKLGAIPNIPYRRTSGITKIGRHKQLKFFENKYSKRNIVETIFSVIKRKYGSYLLSKKFKTQKVELAMKLVAYNIDRKIKNLVIYLRVSY